MDDDSPLLTPEVLSTSNADSQSIKRLLPCDPAELTLASSPKRSRTFDEEETLNVQTEPVNASLILADKYRKLDRVGEGAYGNVYKAENTLTGEIVAIKETIRKEDPCLGGFPLSLLREISILRMVKHDNIVQLYEIAVTPRGDPLMVMEFCHASLLELINSPTHSLSGAEIKFLIRQVLDATAHLHQHGILHRDLATKNVLFNLSGEIKVCDFGISRVAFAFDEKAGFLSARDLEAPDQIVSLPYRAIELLLGERRYGPALDVWSVGCIFMEVVLSQCGRSQPFFGGSRDNPSKTVGAMVEEVFRLLGRPTDDTWPGLSALPLFNSVVSSKAATCRAHRARGDERAFVQAFFSSDEGHPASAKYSLTLNCFSLMAELLALCPAQRISARDALQHPYFNENPSARWYHDHWTQSAAIPRGREMKRGKGDDSKHQLLRQLSKTEEPKQAAEDKTTKLEQWKQQASHRKQAEAEAAAKLEARRAAERQRLERLRIDQQKLEWQNSGPQQLPPKPAGPPLPPEWEAHFSKSQNRWYYHNKTTKQNSWKRPN